MFIHLGKKLPDFLPAALSQAQLFNPNATLILIANQEALAQATFKQNIQIIAAESLQQTFDHKLFNRMSTLNKEFRDGFWFYTTERLFYLNDLIEQYDLKNTFHLENDNLLYADLEELLPVFIEHYPGMAIPFEQDSRGAASFLYVKDKQSINQFAHYLSKHSRSGKSEMYLLSSFKDEFGRAYLDHLPVITDQYGKDHTPLTDPTGRVDQLASEHYSRHYDQFNSLFDMCSYGQYLGGIDPRNGPDGPGYINHLCIFNCSRMTFEWRLDEKGRKVPFAIYGGESYRINNLHIHAKTLNKFTSIEFDYTEEDSKMGRGQEGEGLSGFKQIADLCHPTLDELRLLQHSLSNEERPILKQLGDKENLQRTFKIIGDLPEEIPRLWQRDVNIEPGTKENCVICYASYNQRYPRGCKRVYTAACLSDFRGHVACQVGGWPDLEGGSLTLAPVPFAFKVCFIKEMQRKGYKRVLWLDTSIQPCVSLNTIFQLIEEKGYFVQENTHSLHPPYMTPELAEAFALSYEEACSLPSCSAAIFGVDFSHPTVCQLVDAWYEAALHPTAFYSPRSDQTALSLLLHKFGLTDWMPQSILGTRTNHQNCLFYMDREYVKDQ